MPKITVHGGATQWPGNNSEPLSEKQEISLEKIDYENQQPVQTTENLSLKDLTETFSVPLMGGLSEDEDLNE